MRESLLEAVEELRRRHYANSPALTLEIEIARKRRVPEELLDFYSLCNGALLGEGHDFRAPDGRWFRLSIPALLDLKCAKEFGYISSHEPLYEQSANWWQIADYGDGNWLALDATNEGKGRIIDLFHETVGETGFQMVVATSLIDLLKRLLSADGVFWFEDSFEALGWV